MIAPQDEAIDLIHCLGFIYLRHGQPYRAVVLLIVAGEAAPERADILRTLCLALIDAGMGDQALEVIEKLTVLAPNMAAHRMMQLMRARALLLVGRSDDARHCFAQSQYDAGASPGMLAA
jgi:type III secretion protein Y